LPGDENGLGLGSKAAQLHQNYCNSERRNRHHRVHHDTELAMIGVSRVGVKVGDLGNGEQDQQNQAQACYDRKEPAAILPAGKCPNCLQLDLDALILQNNPLCWTLGG
jgi:hypothetical protein